MRFLDQDAHDPERMAAQRERVLVAGRHRADAEEAGQRLELVGQRHARAGRRVGQRIAGEARAVLLL